MSTDGKVLKFYFCSLSLARGRARARLLPCFGLGAPEREQTLPNLKLKTENDQKQGLKSYLNIFFPFFCIS